MGGRVRFLVYPLIFVENWQIGVFIIGAENPEPAWTNRCIFMSRHTRCHCLGCEERRQFRDKKRLSYADDDLRDYRLCSLTYPSLGESEQSEAGQSLQSTPPIHARKV